MSTAAPSRISFMPGHLPRMGPFTRPGADRCVTVGVVVRATA